MNRAICITALCVAFTLMSCHDSREDVKKTTVETEVYKTIGEEIPFETGLEWIRYHNEKNSGQGRTELLSSFNVSSDKMNQLVASISNVVGMAFHHAYDENGIKHILVIPVDGSMTLWSSIPGRIYVDANTGTEISQNTASAWAANYKNAHPSNIWFHFFGINTIQEMCALPFFNSVEIQPAISLLNLTPQLLLVVYNEDLIPLGRTATSPGVMYDASNPCPPCAVR